MECSDVFFTRQPWLVLCTPYLRLCAPAPLAERSCRSCHQHSAKHDPWEPTRTHDDDRGEGPLLVLRTPLVAPVDAALAELPPLPVGNSFQGPEQDKTSTRAFRHRLQEPHGRPHKLISCSSGCASFLFFPHHQHTFLHDCNCCLHSLSPALPSRAYRNGGSNGDAATHGEPRRSHSTLFDVIVLPVVESVLTIGPFSTRRTAALRCDRCSSDRPSGTLITDSKPFLPPIDLLLRPSAYEMIRTRPKIPSKGRLREPSRGTTGFLVPRQKIVRAAASPRDRRPTIPKRSLRSLESRGAGPRRTRRHHRRPKYTSPKDPHLRTRPSTTSWKTGRPIPTSTSQTFPSSPTATSASTSTSSSMLSSKKL